MTKGHYVPALNDIKILSLISIFTIFSLLFSASTVLAGTYETENNGSWPQQDTWSGNNKTAPSNINYNDVVVISHIVNAEDIKINNGGDLIINRQLTAEEITMNGGMITIYDHLIANNIDAKNSAIILIEEGGQLTLTTFNGAPYDPNKNYAYIINKNGAPVTTLPVKLISFDVKRKNSALFVTWSTTEEVDNDFIALERSADGENFTEISRIAGRNKASLNNYEFTDEKPLAGVNFYRLRQVDYNGSETYSKVVSATATVTEMLVSDAIYFNSNINYGKIVIFNLNGQVVLQQELSQQATVALPQLQKGIYIIHAEVNSEVIVKKVLL